MPNRPNVVVVTTDQQRADACAREGFSLDTTPFLDRLARDGTWFDRAYTSTPVCAPARASLLTGRFPTATGVWVNQQSDAARFERDLFDVVNDAGYRSALVGKNHSHLSPGDADYWAQYGHWGAQSEAAEAFRTDEAAAFEDWLAEMALFDGGGGFSLDPTPFPVETQCAHRCVSQAQNWIEGLDGDDPFFLWLSFPEPHNPYQVPEPYFSMFPPDELPAVSADETALSEKAFKWRWLREIGVARAAREAPDRDYDDVLPRLRANYYGMLRMVDDQVSRFVAFLESAGLREDTLLVFLSDHGDFVGDYGLMRKGVDLPEATTRIPFSVTGPGVQSRRDPHDAHVSIVDVLPTLCDALDLPLPEGVQGQSLWPLLTGTDDGADFDSIYAECGYGGPHSTPATVPDLADASKNELNPHTQTGRTGMVRGDRWKLVYDAERGPALFDLDADPLETTGLSEDPDHAPILREMLEQFAAWSLRVRDTRPTVFSIDEQEPTPRGPRDRRRPGNGT